MPNSYFTAISVYMTWLADSLRIGFIPSTLPFMLNACLHWQTQMAKAYLSFVQSLDQRKISRDAKIMTLPFFYQHPQSFVHLAARFLQGECQRGNTFLYPLSFTLRTWGATNLRNDRLLKEKAYNFYWYFTSFHRKEVKLKKWLSSGAHIPF